MPPIDVRLIVVFLWILACAAAAWQLWRGRGARLPGLAAALTVALVLRVVPALVLPRGASYEMNVFREAAQAFLAGQNVYALPIAHPYLPMQLYWLAAADRLAAALGPSFPFWVKAPGILADTALVALVYAAAGRGRRAAMGRSAWPGSVPLRSAWLYACNPVTILVCAYQGQFDTVPLFLMFAAWLLVDRLVDPEGGTAYREAGAQGRPALFISALLLGLAILSKMWPALLLPILWLRLPRRPVRLAYAAVALAVPVAGVLLYGCLIPSSPVTVFGRALGVGAIPGWWGFSAPINVFVELTGRGAAFYAQAVTGGKLAAAAGGLLAVWLTRRLPVPLAVAATVLAMFALVPNLGLQSLSWLVCWALAAGAFEEILPYEAGVLAHMLISYWGIHLTGGLFILLPDLAARVIIQLSSLTAWGAVLWWLPRALRPAPPGAALAPAQPLAGRTASPFGVK